MTQVLQPMYNAEARGLCNYYNLACDYHTLDYFCYLMAGSQCDNQDGIGKILMILLKYMCVGAAMFTVKEKKVLIALIFLLKECPNWK